MHIAKQASKDRIADRNLLIKRRNILGLNKLKSEEIIDQYLKKAESDPEINETIKRFLAGDYQIDNGWKPSEPQHENFAFLYGCKPALGVDAKTTMVRDFVKTLQNRFDRSTLSVKIPAAFD